jgi:cytochrome oxidase Cu insertion factor (SCO1/SenC/PrrC family)
MNAKNFILVTLAISGVALFLVLQNYPKDSSSTRPRAPLIENVASRGLAPDFTLADLDQNTFQLSDSRGNVLVMMFWTTW